MASTTPKLRAPPSPLAGINSRLLGAPDAPLLQRFMAENPAYFVAVHGALPTSSEALDELNSLPPATYSYGEKVLIGFQTEKGTLIAFANIVTDLFAPGVWLIATFYVATERHGSGDAKAYYLAIEQWAASHGAQWLRLGVVIGNTRAEKFWARAGFMDVIVRHGIAMGQRVNAMQVMVKSLRSATLDDYRALVAQDGGEPPEETIDAKVGACAGVGQAVPLSGDQIRSALEPVRR